MMDSKTIQKQRELIRGMENLMHQGGFFQESIMDLMTEIYPQQVVDVALKYCKPGPGFWTLIDEARNADEFAYFYRSSAYDFDDEDCDTDAESEEEKRLKEEFADWYMDQTVRFASAQMGKKTKCFWQTWDLPPETKRALKRMSALQEKLLFLREGLDSGESRTKEEIAALPEFQCDPYFIGIVLDDIEKRFSHTRFGIQPVCKVCELRRQEICTENQKEKND